MDELHGLNVKPVDWTTKFAFEAPTARQRAILSTASAVGFIGQRHHAAYLARAMISLTKAMATD